MENADNVKRSILVVEDEVFLREGITNLLTEAGWHVHQAGDGHAAVRIFREHPIEVVLTDLLMPRMDGIALLRAIQEIDPDVPAVVLTGYGTIERCIASLQAGAVDFLAKPFEDEHLLAALDRAWRSRGHFLESDEQLQQSHCRFQLDIVADTNLVFAAAVRIEAVFRPLGFYSRRWAIRRAVEEALRNAMIHGAGEQQKSKAVTRTGSAGADAPRQSGVTLPEKSESEALIRVEAEMNESRLCIAVTDPGKGFAYPKTTLPPEEFKHERGIFLIRSFADEARWIAPGNRVEMVFFRKGGRSASLGGRSASLGGRSASLDDRI